MRAVELVFAVGWAAFWLYSILAAFSAKKGRIAWSRELRVRPVIVVLVSSSVRAGGFRGDGVHADPWRAGIGLVFFASGLGFAVWARLHLGRDWGTPMTQKAEPELVTSGPYRLVRHPIYSGILLAGIATAMGLSWLWLTAFALAGVYFVYSATVEERYLAEQFPDAYPPYSARTRCSCRSCSQTPTMVGSGHRETRAPRCCSCRPALVAALALDQGGFDPSAWVWSGALAAWAASDGGGGLMRGSASRAPSWSGSLAAASPRVPERGQPPRGPDRARRTQTVHLEVRRTAVYAAAVLALPSCSYAEAAPQTPDARFSRRHRSAFVAYALARYLIEPQTHRPVRGNPARTAARLCERTCRARGDRGRPRCRARLRHAERALSAHPPLPRRSQSRGRAPAAPGRVARVALDGA